MRKSSLAAFLFLAPHWSHAVSLSLPEVKRVPAQAEVSATNSPVKLTLSVYKTELKLQDGFKVETDFKRLWKDHPMKGDKYDWENIDEEKYLIRTPIKTGEPLWIKIRLTNVGKKPMLVMDDLFTGPKDFKEALEEAGRSDVSIIITGPDGKKIPWESSRDISATSCPKNTSTLDPVGTAKAAAWRKEGKTTEQIDDLLERDLRENERKKREQKQARHPIKKLEPGEAIATGPWRYHGKCKGDSALQPPQVGDFAELWNFHLNTPGVYGIKVEYFGDPYARSKGKKISLETPSIKITVRP